MGSLLRLDWAWIPNPYDVRTRLAVRRESRPSSNEPIIHGNSSRRAVLCFPYSPWKPDSHLPWASQLRRMGLCGARDSRTEPIRASTTLKQDWVFLRSGRTSVCTVPTCFGLQVQEQRILWGAMQPDFGCFCFLLLLSSRFQYESAPFRHSVDHFSPGDNGLYHHGGVRGCLLGSAHILSCIGSLLVPFPKR